MKHLLLSLLGVVFILPSFAQNSCSTATVIAAGIHTTGPLDGTAPTELCIGGALANAGTWYSFTAISDTTMQLTTHINGYPDVDTRVHIYVGACDMLTCYASDDDSGPNYSSIVNFPVVSGTKYTIAFDTYWNASPFTFNLYALFTPPPPEGSVSFISTQILGMGGVMGVVDMNNDGLDDAVGPGGSSIQIGYQLATSGFITSTYQTTQAVNDAGWSFAIGDWDSNGHRDLLYGGGNGATFMKADATGTSYEQIYFPQYIFCQRTNFADLNNDGHLDAFSCHDVDANVAFINDGSGNLVFTQGGYGTTCGNYGSIFTDIDNDGVVDLFVAKCGCDPQDLLMPNDGHGVFTNIAPALGLSDNHQSWSSAWGDFDNDGDMDVLIGASSGIVHKLMRNEGDGTFVDVSIGSGMDSFVGQSIEWTAHDFNNDGWVDIMGGGAIHYNNGNMTFSHDNAAPGNHAIGDLNNDGFLDVIGGSGYMRNTGNDNNWIKIIPVGTLSNRDAIGARVTVTSAIGSQIREVRSGDGFRYMSYIGAYFGIGEDTEVEQVSIHWPNGETEVFNNPAINTTHTFVEGLTTAIAENDTQALSMFPNPATDMVTITGVSLNANVEVFDALGKLVLRERLQGGRLHVGKLATGIHQLRVTENGVVRELRFNKQ